MLPGGTWLPTWQYCTLWFELRMCSWRCGAVSANGVPAVYFVVFNYRSKSTEDNPAVFPSLCCDHGHLSYRHYGGMQGKRCAHCSLSDALTPLEPQSRFRGQTTRSSLSDALTPLEPQSRFGDKLLGI